MSAPVKAVHATDAPRDLRVHAVRSRMPILVAAGTLGLGYLDLARGGTTLSAVLLVIGYVVAVPWAIMTSGTGRSR